MVQYTGSKADREMIRKHEFFHAGHDKAKKKKYKFDVLLVSTLDPVCLFMPMHPCMGASFAMLLLQV